MIKQISMSTLKFYLEHCHVRSGSLGQQLKNNQWRWRLYRVHLWSEMGQGVRVLHCWLCAVFSTCPWRLQYLELNIQKQENLLYVSTKQQNLKPWKCHTACASPTSYKTTKHWCSLGLDLQSIVLLLPVAIRCLSSHLVVLGRGWIVPTN